MNFLSKSRTAASSSHKFCALFPALITGLIAAGQLFRYPSELRDIATGGFPPGLKLDYPLIYTIFSPFFHLADNISILSKCQHVTLLIYIIAAGFLSVFYCNGTISAQNISLRTLNFFWRIIVRLVLIILLYLMILEIILTIPRPMARIAVADPDVIAVDFHSHTSYSWDGRRSFTPSENKKWHENAGFNVSFITDHSAYKGAEEGFNISRDGGVKCLYGEEESLWKTIWIVIGNHRLIGDKRYDPPEHFRGVALFLNAMRSSGSMLVISSFTPKLYAEWRDHFDALKNWGMDGMEIANAAPLYMDLSPELRAFICEFCRKNGLFIIGGSNNHGWTYTAYSWNLMRIEGFKTMDPAEVEAAILKKLEKDKFEAVTVVTRVKFERQNDPAWLLLDPLFQVFEASRAMPLSHAVISILWFFGFAAMIRKFILMNGRIKA